MKTSLPLSLSAVAVLAFSGLTGCAAQNKQVVSTTARDTAKTTPPPSAAPITASTSDDDADGPASFAPIHYELDSARLLPESQDELARLADHLRKHPNATVQISGHTCELGTSEYNLALGQKRAAAAREYLLKLGVDERRISTVSYGEERPLDEDHTEPARAKNRRSEFEVRVALGSVGR